MWDHLARVLFTLAPDAVSTQGQHAMLFSVPDGRYRLQVFALADRRDDLSVFARDVLDEAVAHGIQGEGRVIGRKIEDIPLPSGTTIGAIVRGDEVIIAHHDTVIHRDDHVILFLTDRRYVEVVEKLFDVPRRKGA